MSVKRDTALMVTFAAIDSTNRPVRKSGLVFTVGATMISKDGGAFANTTNTPVEIGTTGRYQLQLTAIEMDASWVHLIVSLNGMDDVDMVLGTSGHSTGVIVSDPGNTAQTFKTNLTDAVDSYWVDTLIMFTTGALFGQVKKVTAYSGTTKFITTQSAFTSTPAAGDRFMLLNI